VRTRATLSPSDEWKTRVHVGVVDQVRELVVEVAIVDVDRDAADLHRGEVGLAVLGRVVEIHADLGVRTEPGVEERPCERAARAS
jgi:hypothetical protein